jgi:hypothetical protein
MYSIEDLHQSVNDIYEQLDEGKMEEADALEILRNCCREFLQVHPMGFTSDADVNWTSYKGSIETTFTDLCRVFGPPDEGPNAVDQDKVSCVWRLKFEDGTIASIYDWKTRATPFGLYDWHIGGHDIKAVDRIREAMRCVDLISIEKK